MINDNYPKYVILLTQVIPLGIQRREKGSFCGVKDVCPYDSSDIRFTQKGETLYAFCMKTPTGDVKIVSFGKRSKISDQKVKAVTLLGSKEKLNWKQDAEALVISKPSKLPDWEVATFKIEFKK